MLFEADARDIMSLLHERKERYRTLKLKNSKAQKINQKIRKIDHLSKSRPELQTDRSLAVDFLWIRAMWNSCLLSVKRRSSSDLSRTSHEYLGDPLKLCRSLILGVDGIKSVLRFIEWSCNLAVHLSASKYWINWQHKINFQGISTEKTFRYLSQLCKCCFRLQAWWGCLNNTK